jgi:hypothetical protein
MKIAKTISVCCKKDLSSWRIASRYIAENIESENYVVIVPDNEVRLFRENSPPDYQVVAESKYAEHYKDYLFRKIPEDKKGRFGWYLQQFIKLSALSDANADELYLIWDADTVPLKKLEFTNGEKILHYTAQEHHQPYFDLINSLLALPRQAPYSFIAQCFAIKGNWSDAFFRFIEEAHRKQWAEAIIDCINFAEGSGFSEYETLGTFIAHKYGSEICPLPNDWCRYGNTLIGGPENISSADAQLKLRSYDFISFENWDNPTQRIFQKIYLNKVWGESQDASLPFFSGGGSHNEFAVAQYINSIITFIQGLPEKPSVVDLGCGDFFVGAQIRPYCHSYIACDIVPELIHFNRDYYASTHTDFRVLDIIKDELPTAEIVIIRQVLQHLSNRDIKALVGKLCTNFKYLILTEHLPTDVNFTPNLDHPTGSGIRLNLNSGVVLTSPPFNLPAKNESLLSDVFQDGGFIRTVAYRM